MLCTRKWSTEWTLERGLSDRVDELLLSWNQVKQPYTKYDFPMLSLDLGLNLNHIIVSIMQG